MSKTSSPEQRGQLEIYGSYRGAATSQLDALARSCGAGQPEMVPAARKGYSHGQVGARFSREFSGLPPRLGFNELPQNTPEGLSQRNEPREVSHKS